MKPMASNKDTRKVKLHPIQLLANLKAQKENSGASSNQRHKRIQLKAYSTVKLEENCAKVEVDLEDHLGSLDIEHFENNSSSSECYEDLEEIKFSEKSEIDCSIASKYINKEATDIEKSKESDTIGGYWKIFYLRQKELKFPLMNKSNWLQYRIWRGVMKRGIDCIQRRWRQRIDATVRIQSAWKMHVMHRKYRKILHAAEYITRYWRYTWILKKRFIAIKKLVSILQPLVR